MKIHQSDITESVLSQHATRATSMFREKDFSNLVKEYGYAVANGRAHVAAIQEDFERALFGSATIDYGAAFFLGNPLEGTELQTFGTNEIRIAASFSEIRIARFRDRIAVFDLVVFGTLKDGYDVSIEDVYEYRFAA